MAAFAGIGRGEMAAALARRVGSVVARRTGAGNIGVAEIGGSPAGSHMAGSALSADRNVSCALACGLVAVVA